MGEERLRNLREEIEELTLEIVKLAIKRKSGKSNDVSQRQGFNISARAVLQAAVE